MASPFDSQYDVIRNKIIYYADQWGLPENIGIWQIWYESNYRTNANSGKARGIAQFTPATAARFGVDVTDVDSSLDGWGQYMAWLLQRPYINGNISLALAAYNAGEGSVQKYGGVPPFAETVSYVRKIMNSAGATADVSVSQTSGDNLDYSTIAATNNDTSGGNSNVGIWIGLGLAALFLLGE